MFPSSLYILRYHLVGDGFGSINGPIKDLPGGLLSGIG